MKDACTCIPSGQECHCVKCCLNFSSEYTFECHFGPGGVHLDPAEARNKKGKELLKAVERSSPSRVVWVSAKEWGSPIPGKG